MSLMFLHASIEMYEELGHFSLWTRELSDSYFHRTAKGFYVLSSILKKHVLFVKQDKYRERAVQALSGFQIQINLPLFR